MEKLQTIVSRLSGMGCTFEALDPREYEKMKVDAVNESLGNLNDWDDYDCKQCRNKGYVMQLKEMPDGQYSQVVRDCKCMNIRRTLCHMQKSGLKNVIRNCTFDRYEATEDWQKTLKSKAVEYANDPQGWFAICGQPGIGKSHLCTAICRKFLLNGRKVAYMAWLDDVEKLKNFEADNEQRTELLERFKKSDVLYIDDLFKTGAGQGGGKQWPTSADIRKAFEIINYRYNNPELLTIVSSEWTMDELLSIDEATGSRIFERAGTNGISVGIDRAKNYRTRQAVTL